MAIIEIENLSHRFADGTAALDGIRLSIAQQTLTVIAGCNGSGKTTLLKHINGLIRPQSGTVTVAGIDVRRHPEKARRVVGMVFQDADSQIVGETVFADVAFGPENQKLSRTQIQNRVESALAAVGLTHLADRHPHLLSGGEKRRLAIAGVLAMQPRVVMFDEPFSNLDLPGMQQTLQQMMALKTSGHTLLVTTHELEKIFAIAQRIVVMREGRIVADGQPEQINRQVAGYGVRPACSACRLEVPWPN
jgi:biotin transport system ATP-binding protein